MIRMRTRTRKVALSNNKLKKRSNRKVKKKMYLWKMKPKKFLKRLLVNKMITSQKMRERMKSSTLLRIFNLMNKTSLIKIVISKNSLLLTKSTHLN